MQWERGTINVYIFFFVQWVTRRKGFCLNCTAMRRLLFSFFAGCIVTIVVWERIAISKWMAHQYAGVMETRRSTDAVEDVVKTYTEGIHVLTSFYMDTNVKRRNEIWSSITNNIAHKFVKKVHLMFEGGDAAQLPPLKENLKEKLVVVPVDAQPTYKRFFEYANRVLLRGTIAVVLNADIYIGEGFWMLAATRKEQLMG